MDVGNKIKKLMSEGKKKDQAVAIALNMAVTKKKLKKSKQE